MNSHIGCLFLSAALQRSVKQNWMRQMQHCLLSVENTSFKSVHGGPLLEHQKKDTMEFSWLVLISKQREDDQAVLQVSTSLLRVPQLGERTMHTFMFGKLCNAQTGAGARAQ